ncbi:hypothetical protein LTS08_000870 [Lithohypha guttulata]|uniref:uncharacterized protein n=1 Tax=Lithohypha guttulata TaxID=1690604 RepID=UPI002DE11CB6|nr:hypothetical protein LTR51_006516 [Lithohypha guttulata]KAK5106748.1 hypothetical protein LTS08_000870 [Lithohypha guttulata]
MNGFEASANKKLKRPYVRKYTNNAPGIRVPTSPPQIADLAFNIHGWAMEDRLASSRTVFEVINAYNATMVKGGFEAKIKELEQEGVGSVYRQDLTYTARELDTSLAGNDSSVSQYLVVGYTLQEHDPVFQDNKTFLRYSENELVGETRPEAEHIISWNEVLTPILVVTPIKENTGTSVRLFALIMPRSGLCQPVLITHERIFYRWEYRASAGARPAQRNKNWNQVIVDKAKELTPPEQLINHDFEDAPRPVIKRSTSTVPFIKQEEGEDGDILFANLTNELADLDMFELHLDLRRLFEPLAERDRRIVISDMSAGLMSRLKVGLNEESRGILEAIRTSRSSRVIQQVRTSFLKVSKASGQIPTERYHGLACFTQPGTGFDRGGMEHVLAEMRNLWPEMGPLIDHNSVVRIKHGMNQMNMVVSFETMKEFFGSALAYLRTNFQCSDLDLRNKLVEAAQKSMIMSRSPMLTRHDTETIGMDAVYLVALMSEIVAIHAWQDERARRMFYCQVPASFQGMEVEHHLNIESIEQATRRLPQHIRHIVSYAQSRQCGTDDILLWLERLRLRIRQVDGSLQT